MDESLSPSNHKWPPLWWLILLLVLHLPTHAATEAQKYGAVYARVVVYSENGYPVYVEYSDDGIELWQIGEVTPDSEYAHSYVISAGYYLNLKNYWTTLNAQYAGAGYPALETISKAEYNSRLFDTADGFSIWSPRLDANTTYVTVAPQSLRAEEDGSDLVLMELPFDPNQIGGDPSGTTRSLLLSKASVVVPGLSSGGEKRGIAVGCCDMRYTCP